VSVVAVFPEESYEAIVYPVAATAEGAAAARGFLDFLQGPEADAIFLGHGFTLR
jgi:molybdate transport system substrate-binding protein